MGNPGDKYDAEKLRWDLLPINTIEGIVGVLTFGARKYAPDGWRSVPEAKRRYFAALLRHLFAWWRGETHDRESGLHHLHHAGCCLIFLSELDGCPQDSLITQTPMSNSEPSKSYPAPTAASLSSIPVESRGNALLDGSKP